MKPSRPEPASHRFVVAKKIALVAAEIQEILAIQRELAIGGELLAGGQKQATRGLLFANHTPDELKKSVAVGGAIFLSTEAGNQRPVGYLLATPGVQFVPELIPARKVWSSTAFQDRYTTIGKTYYPRYGLLTEVRCDLMVKQL